MNNIIVRTLSGSVFITLILLPLFLNKDYLYIPVLFLFIVLGINEFHNLFDKEASISIHKKIATPVSILSAVILSLGIWNFLYSGIIIFIPFLFLILFISELYRDKQNPIVNIALPVFGFFYITVPLLLAMVFQKYTGETFPYLAMMFILIWTNDTFAFLCGRTFGKTKLFERISPKKTWEGTVGGITCTIIMVFCATLIFTIPDPVFWYISVLFIAPAAIFGDLVESLFKRSLNIKDSGNIMPGHGGILDRFDASLFAIPAFLMWYFIYYHLI